MFTVKKKPTKDKSISRVQRRSARAAVTTPHGRSARQSSAENHLYGRAAARRLVLHRYIVRSGTQYTVTKSTDNSKHLSSIYSVSIVKKKHFAQITFSCSGLAAPN